MVESEARVYFAIKTEDGLIQESTISNHIGLKPTEFFKMHEKGNTPKCTSWQISTDKIKNPCVHDMIDNILDILSSCRGNLKEFKKTYPQVEYVFQIVIEHGDNAEGLGFNNNQLCLLSEIGAFVDVDQYNYKDCEEEIIINITYKEIKEDYDKEQLKLLYHDTEWISYGNDLEKTERAIRKSLCTIGAYHEDVLVGIVRVVGDEERVIYFQELVVLSQYKRWGIGKTLVEMIIDKYKHVPDIVVITDNTDNNPETNRFYQALGFKLASDMGIVCYLKFEH